MCFKLHRLLTVLTNEEPKERLLEEEWFWHQEKSPAVKTGRWGNWIWISRGDGQLFSLFTTCTAERWWDLCPNITDICYEPRVRPPVGTELQPETTGNSRKISLLSQFGYLYLSVIAFIRWYSVNMQKFQNENVPVWAQLNKNGKIKSANPPKWHGTETGKMKYD